MLRSYRFFVIAAFGWLSLAATEQPSGKNSTTETQATTGIEKATVPITVAIAAPIEIIERPVEQPACGPRQYQSRDDLCAQWKAADSASDSALWTKWGVLVAVLGTLGLYWQIKLTREAVQDTGKATMAMEAANAIARDGADHARQEYVRRAEIERPRILLTFGEHRENEAGEYEIPVLATNTGEIDCFITSFAAAKSDTNDIPKTGNTFYLATDMLLHVPAKQSVLVTNILRTSADNAERFYRGIVRYFSAVGEAQHVTNFCYSILIDTISIDGPKPVRIKLDKGSNWPKDT